jgi:hypothetical protein
VNWFKTPTEEHALALCSSAIAVGRSIESLSQLLAGPFLCTSSLREVPAGPMVVLDHSH